MADRHKVQALAKLDQASGFDLWAKLSAGRALAVSAGRAGRAPPDRGQVVFMMRGSVLAESGSVAADKHPERLVKQLLEQYMVLHPVDEDTELQAPLVATSYAAIGAMPEDDDPRGTKWVDLLDEGACEFFVSRGGNSAVTSYLRCINVCRGFPVGGIDPPTEEEKDAIRPPPLPSFLLWTRSPQRRGPGAGVIDLATDEAAGAATGVIDLASDLASDE